MLVEHVLRANGATASGEAVGYPPENVKVRVTGWGPNAHPESVRQHVRSERDVNAWSGKVVSELEDRPA